MSASLNPSALSSLPPANEIPSAFAASMKQWWAAGEKQSVISEERLLRRLPFFRKDASASVDGPVVAHSSRVELSTPKHYVNTFSITPASPSSTAPPPTVLLHGYGAGLGFYFQNFLPLADWAGRRGSSVYALDWLGMGRSARVPFTVKASRKDIPGRKMGLDKMTLVGHSLGAYFSVVYALKYPTRVNKLILLSPAGVPRGPDYSHMDLAGLTEPATAQKVQEIESRQRTVKAQESRTRKLFTYLWEEGWSPFQVVRSTMFWGPLIVGKYSSRRFTGLTPEETRDMHDYILNITLAKGSGEMPIVDRISALKIPVTFVYGDHDWMDPEGGVDSVERLRQAGNGQGRMYIVNNAGHHWRTVYLDNAKLVNDLLLKELDRQPLV
ncbi:Alpha/Beta hydrolase protein [Armillaria luteobubalina]|uniref:Alpha/Beta hydrolase protein n=1 Tax=Armillaria luteobubalina TaxID=153913 RepID=A0AA39QA34_9AGAR|nr:Alpha/Beta hydrolase protein [Armillaria luteobubalina]